MKADVRAHVADVDVRRALARITALLQSAYAHTGVPTETRHCLDQLSAEVEGLTEVYGRLTQPGAGAGGTAVGPAVRDALFLGSIGAPSRPSTDPEAQLRKLTPQERRILDFIAEGCTNRQIATELFLAEKTIKNYVSNMLRKLGMERRTQAAVFATRLDQTSTSDAKARSAFAEAACT